MTSAIVKRAIILVNLCILSGGAVLVAYGVEYRDNERERITIFGDFRFGILAICTGCFALVLSIFGCVAIWLEQKLLLKIYAGAIFAVFIVQMSLGVMAVTKIENNTKFVEEINKSLGPLFDEGGTYSYFDRLQQDLKCCGIQSPSDYPANYPSSCCLSNMAPCLSPFQNGCGEVYADLMDEKIRTIGNVGIVFAVVEVVGAFLALAARKITHLKEPETYY